MTPGKRVLGRSGGLFLVFFVMCSLSLRGAMLIYGYDDARHDRFYAWEDRAFLAPEYDLSGVGLSNGLRWGTMISPTHFLSAAHYPPGSGQTLSFFPGNDPDVAPIERVVAGGQTISGTDLWVGWFAADDPVPDMIATYPVFYDRGPGFVGNDLLVLGRDETSGETSQCAGTNTVSAAGLTTIGEVALLSYEEIVDECRVVSGDSGGPSFVTINGMYSLFGVNYGYYTDNDGNPLGSVVTRIPAYIDEINAILATRGEELTVVPETSTALLALVVVAAIGVWRIRQ